MAMLAGPKRRKSYNLVPRGKALYHDEDRLGSKLLAKMGWTKGKGLGANETGSVDFVRVRYKNDCDGLGFEERDDQWTQHSEEYNGLLEKLNSTDVVETQQQQNGHINHSREGDEANALPAFGLGFAQSDTTTKSENQTKFKEKLSGESLEEKSMRSRARVHYQKFTRGKDLARYSEKDLANIFGKKANEAEEVKPIEHVAWEGAETKDEVNTKKSLMVIETGISVNDYFKQKMEALKNRKQQGFTGNNNVPAGNGFEAIEDGEKHKSLKRQKSDEDAHKQNDSSADEVGKAKKQKLENGFVNEQEEEEIPSKKKKNKKHKKEKDEKEDEQVPVDDNNVAIIIEDEPVLSKQKKKKSKRRESVEESMGTAGLEEGNNESVAAEDTTALIENSEKSKKKKRKKKSKEPSKEPANMQLESQNTNSGTIHANMDAVILLDETPDHMENSEELKKKNKKKKSKERQEEPANPDVLDAVAAVIEIEDSDEPAKKKKKKTKDRQRESSDELQNSNQKNCDIEAQDEPRKFTDICEESQQKNKKKSKDRHREINESIESQQQNEVLEVTGDDSAIEKNIKESSKKKSKEHIEETKDDQKETPKNDEENGKKMESKEKTSSDEDSDSDSDSNSDSDRDSEAEVSKEVNTKEPSKKNKKKKSKEHIEENYDEQRETSKIEEKNSEKKESKEKTTTDESRNDKEENKEKETQAVVLPANDDYHDHSSDYVSDDELTKKVETSAELNEILNRLKNQNVFRLSSIKAEKLAMLNLHVYKGSTLPDITGYRLKENLKLKIYYPPTRDNKIINITDYRVRKYKKIRGKIINCAKIEKMKRRELLYASKRLRRQKFNMKEDAVEATEIATSNVKEQNNEEVIVKPLELPSTANDDINSSEHSSKPVSSGQHPSATTIQTAEVSNPKENPFKHEKSKLTKSQLKKQEKELKRLQNQKRRLQKKQRARYVFTGL